MSCNQWLPKETRDITVDGPYDYASAKNGIYIASSSTENNELNRDNTLYTTWQSIAKISPTRHNIIQAYHSGTLYDHKKRRQIVWQEGNKKISLDDLLWYLRYETTASISEIFNESKNGSGIRIHHTNYGEIFRLSHSISHSILRAISGLNQQ